MQSLEVGVDMFREDKFESFYGDLTNLKYPIRMFSDNSTMKVFYCDDINDENTVAFSNDYSKIDSEKYSDDLKAKLRAERANNLVIEGDYLKNGMFNYCTSLESFSGNLKNLVSGYNMFFNCYNLSSFEAVSLDKLEMGYQMFCCRTTPKEELSKLTSFYYELPELLYGVSMFQSQRTMTSFASSMPKLKYAEKMFFDCETLTDFEASMPNVIDAKDMFAGCAELQSFEGDLKLLNNAENMFGIANSDG